MWLKSGGYVVIDHTEALTVVDVNTGRYVGKKSQEETVLKTNLEAVKTIVEQLRLRNIGGLIVIDFIDMEDPANQREVFEDFARCGQEGQGRSRLLPISELGLIEMTRKRTRESLMQLLCSPCPTCDAKGHIKATATIAYEVFRRIHREAVLNQSLAQITVQCIPPSPSSSTHRKIARSARWKPRSARRSSSSRPRHSRATVRSHRASKPRRDGHPLGLIGPVDPGLLLLPSCARASTRFVTR